MKKSIYLLLFSLIITSCNSLEQLLELKVNNDLTESVDAHVPQTGATAVAFNLNTTANLNTGDFAQYAGKISALKINTFSFKFKEFSGNNTGTIPTATLKLDDIDLLTLNNINISQSANANTSFNISDATVLSQVETALLNSNSISLKLDGNVLSEAGSMEFKVEISMNMTATINQ